MELLKPEIQRRHRRYLKKEGLEIRFKDFELPKEQSETEYYYAYWTRRGQYDDFVVFSSSMMFEERRVLYRGESQKEVERVARAINNSLRLLAGYYDADEEYKADKFPLLD